MRPIQSPDDPSAIVSACDSTVYRIARNVQRQGKFWVKAQPYSMADMLDHHHVDEFVGGDVFQAFLNPFNYHRWHSPVAGTIREAFVKEGLYFSQAPSEGEDWTDQDHSEAYIAHVQTRAILFIEADNKAIGLICVMPIGMVEISSCIIDDRIKPGARVEKGQELGYFQFGGSTHCVMFRKGVIRAFTGQENSPYQVGQVIAFANAPEA
jgi:phosphatidylserine decarboxylase